MRGYFGLNRKTDLSNCKLAFMPQNQVLRILVFHFFMKLRKTTSKCDQYLRPRILNRIVLRDNDILLYAFR